MTLTMLSKYHSIYFIGPPINLLYKVKNKNVLDCFNTTSLRLQQQVPMYTKTYLVHALTFQAL